MQHVVIASLRRAILVVTLISAPYVLRGDCPDFSADAVDLTRRTALLTGGHTYGQAVADFNGDGRSDVAAGSGSRVNILITTADGGVAPVVEYVVGSFPHYIIAKDLNGDSKIDLATANYEGRSISFLAGAGDGTFTQAVTVPTKFAAAPTTIALTAGGFDGSGTQKLAVANYSANTVSMDRGVAINVFRVRRKRHRGGFWSDVSCRWPAMRTG